VSTGHRVVFRVDESSLVGFGHMSRCRALADALLKAHAQVSFWCSNVRPVTCAALEHSGVTVINLSNEEAFLQQDWSNSVVVVDGYQFNEVFWQRLMAIHPRRTVCIDDFRGIRYLADIVVCYNEGLEAQQFQLAPNTRLFLGGRYLLLRPEILAAARLADHPSPRRALMITAGGTRQDRWVADMLAHLARLEPSSPLWVLSGRRLPVAKVLYRSGIHRSQVRFVSGLDASAMIRRYRQARCLLTPASTVMLEAFTVGCPMISGWVADNQCNSLDWYDRRGLIVNTGDLRQVSGKALALAYARVRRQSGQMSREQRAYIKDSEAGIDEIVSAILAID
jgi:UDP-2,4-diacetamido-2,4,6-trideoxy-beta-L-altropyranose hydrolase